MAIAIRSIKEIESIANASVLVDKALKKVQSYAVAGISLNELDKIADDFIRSCGALPSFKGLYGFPKSICLSVNEVIIHGIPNDYVLKNGDILGVDIGVNYKGWYGDAAVTFAIGRTSDDNLKLIDCSHSVLMQAIENIKVGMRFRELSALLSDLISVRNFVPLRGFCGHGIGANPHEEPEIPNFIDGDIMKGPKIRNGMVFCIEPMICFKSGEPRVLNDNWSVISQDGLNGSHHEHTIAIINNKAIVLSRE